jgi:hypothetical protein
MKFEDAAKLMREGKTCTCGDRLVKYRINSAGALEALLPEGHVDGCLHFKVNVALSLDWREVQETHDFAWAREQLKQGKNVKRLSGRREVLFAVAANAYAFSLEDIDATDWVLV